MIEEKKAESQRQKNKIEEDANFPDKIKVGVMLPLSGENSEIGNLILSTSVLVCLMIIYWR